MCWKPGWMSGDPCAGGNLPWKLEVLSQGRGLQGREWARLEKTSRERGLPGAARETSPSFLSSCVCSHPGRWVLAPPQTAPNGEAYITWTFARKNSCSDLGHRLPGRHGAGFSVGKMGCLSGCPSRSSSGLFLKRLPQTFLTRPKGTTCSQGAIPLLSKQNQGWRGGERKDVRLFIHWTFTGHFWGLGGGHCCKTPQPVLTETNTKAHPCILFLIRLCWYRWRLSFGYDTFFWPWKGQSRRRCFIIKVFLGCF